MFLYQREKLFSINGVVADMKSLVLIINRSLIHGLFNQVPRRFLMSVLNIISIVVVVSNWLLFLVLIDS